MNYKVILSNLKYFYKFLDSRSYILFLLMLFGAFFEVVGVGLFMPLIIGEESQFSAIMKTLFTNINIEYNNVNVAISIITIFCSKFIIVNIQNYYIFKVSFDFLLNVKSILMEKVFNINFLSFTSLGVENLNNIFTKEIEKTSLSIRYLFQTAVSAIYTLAYLLFALTINHYVVFTAAIVGSAVVGAQKWITREIINYSKKIVEGNEKTHLVVLQILNNLKYIRSTFTNEYNLDMFKTVSKKYSEDSEKMSFLNSIPRHTPELVGILIISSIVLVNEITIKEDVSTVVFLGVLLYRTLTKLLTVQKSYQNFLIHVGSIEKLVETENMLNQNLEDKSISEGELKAIDTLRFTDANFEIGQKSIIKGLEFTFSKGNIYSIVGESGAGKSTILNLITGLYSSSNHCYTINDKPINHINKDKFRSSIGYVSQEAVIFAGSVKENILFGKKLDNQLYEELIKSLKLSSVESKTLTMGGTNISGGQRQLIAVARELYKNPEILILDEYTSALDSLSEKIVLEYIHKYKADKIIIVVAHRLSSIIKSDQVLLMKAGQLSHSGSFEDLYQQSSEFKRMCNAQNITI